GGLLSGWHGSTVRRRRLLLRVDPAVGSRQLDSHVRQGHSHRRAICRSWRAMPGPEALKREKTNPMDLPLQKPAFVAAKTFPKAKTIIYLILTALFCPNMRESWSCT